MNKDVTEFAEAIAVEMNHIQSTVAGQPTEELIKELDERHYKMCTGKWEGPETPYVKVIKDLYKNRDWSEYENKL